MNKPVIVGVNPGPHAIIMENVKKIAEKKARGEYAYERQVIHNHLSKAKCDDFIYRNNRAGGTYVYMHRHKEREEVDCDSQNNQI